MLLPLFIYYRYHLANINHFIAVLPVRLLIYVPLLLNYFFKTFKNEDYWCLNLNPLGTLAYNIVSQQLYWHSWRDRSKEWENSKLRSTSATVAAEWNLSCNFTQLIMNHLIYCSRGIDVVRNKIKMFAQQKVTLPKGRHKIIILDEADRYIVLFLTSALMWMSCFCPVCRAAVLGASIRLSKPIC